MVCGLLLAAGCMERTCSQKLSAVRLVCGIGADGLDHLGKVEGFGIDRVINAGIADVAVHVKALGKTHGAGRRETLGGSSGHEARGVEGRRRLDRAPLLLDARDTGARRSVDVGHHRVRSVLAFETRRGVGRLKTVVTLAE